MEYILMDLDGTLTDSKEGITKCLQYALEYFGVQIDNLNSLEKYIGPPLEQTFREGFGFGKEQAEVRTQCRGHCKRVQCHSLAGRLPLAAL